MYFNGYQLRSKQPHRVLSMMWNNHHHVMITKVMNVDVIDPRLLHFSQRVCDDDEDECMLNIGHTSSVSV